MAKESDRRTDRGQESRSAFLREVLLRGPVTRKEIADRIGLDPGQVTRIARRLIDDGLVRERRRGPGEVPVGPGRASRPLTVDPRGGQVLGVGITPTVQTVALADIGRTVTASADFQFEPIGDAEALMRRLADEFRRLADTQLGDRSRLLGGLVMITGEVDQEAGTVLDAPFLGWGPFPLGPRLAELLNMPVLVRGLAPAIAEVEMMFGVARGRRDLLSMICGLGIATAVFVDGRPVGDSGYSSGAIGTMQMFDEEGRTRTLDGLAGGAGILRRLLGERTTPAPLSHIDLDLHDAIERDRAGDPRVAALMGMAGRELARIMAAHAHFVRPELVLISGPLSTSPSYMAAIRMFLSEAMTPPIEVAVSRVAGAEGGWWASCSLAVHEYLVDRPIDLPGS